MHRSLLLSACALALLLSASRAHAQMFYPVDHPEPITVRFLDSQDGHPVANLHLAFVAGYDSSDLKKHLWKEDALTDAQGNASLPHSLVNLPWLQIALGKAWVCKGNPREQIFSVERTRTEGYSATNRCGTVTASEQPGLLTVFVEDRKPAAKNQPGATIAPTPSRIP